MLLVVIAGFFYSLSTVAYVVLALRTAGGAQNVPPPPPKVVKPRIIKINPPAPVSTKAFQDETLKFLTITSLISLSVSIGATRMDFAYATPIQTIATLCCTLAGFVWGARFPANVTKVLHPLVTATAVCLATNQVLALGTGTEFLDLLRTFKVGSVDPMKMGGGDVLLWLLGPSVVSFAIAMYGRKQLLKENLFIVLTSMMISSAGGLYGTAAFVRAISFGGSNGRIARLSILSRNVTTAVSMAIASIIGGDLSICALAVVLTGIFGATFGRPLMTKMGLHDPVTRGLGLGCAAQGLGAAAMIPEPDAFPFAAIAMVLTAISATIIVSIPALKDPLINLATGA